MDFFSSLSLSGSGNSNQNDRYRVPGSSENFTDESQPGKVNPLENEGIQKVWTSYGGDSRLIIRCKDKNGGDKQQRECDQLFLQRMNNATR